MNALAKQRLARLDTQAKFPYLVEITYYDNNKTAEVMRYANCEENITFEGNVYQASLFSLSPPEIKQDSIGNASITISAIDQKWVERIRNTKYRAEIRFIAVIVYDDNGERQVENMEDYNFILTSAEWDDVAIKWTMVFDEGFSLIMPCDTATSQKVPALG